MLTKNITGVYIFNNPTYDDSRGYFREWSKVSKFQSLNLNLYFKQFNLSKSHLGTIRGLHFAPLKINQYKIITCASGSVIDTILDLRLESKTYLQHAQIEISQESGTSILISPGLAHGFQALSNNSVLVYGVTEEYDPITEQCINPLDSDLEINWPIPNPILSNKDLSAQSLATYLKNLAL